MDTPLSPHTVVDPPSSASITDKPIHLGRGEMEQQELRVFYVLALAFLLFAAIGFITIKATGEARRRVLVPLLTYLCFFSIDSLYRQWTELQTVYGSKPLELAFFRIALMGLIAKLIDVKIGLSATVKEETPESGVHVNTIAHWFLWFPLVGLCLALEELVTSFPESFIGLLLSLLLLAYKQRSQARASKLFWVCSALAISGVLMAKTGSVTWRSALAGLARTLWVFGIDFVMVKHGPISPFKLIYGPCLFASVFSFLAFIFFEFTHPRHALDDAPQRGLLDFLSAAVLGSFFSLTSMISMIEIATSSSIASLQVVTLLVEILVFDIFTPLGGLPLHFNVVLGLNITGVVLAVLSGLVALRTDPFTPTAGASVMGMLGNSSQAVFKFLDEEIAQAEKEEGTSVKEVGEDEWLMTFSKGNPSKPVMKKGTAQNV